MNEVVWLGETRCDACNDDCRRHKELSDVRTSLGWMVLCKSCRIGSSYGVGKGQRYVLKDDKFTKVEG